MAVSRRYIHLTPEKQRVKNMVNMVNTVCVSSTPVEGLGSRTFRTRAFLLAVVPLFSVDRVVGGSW